MAAGAALARKMKKRPGRVFCLMSDGEWDEGSNWESLIFLAHHRLDNMTIMVDANRLQGFGTTDEVARLEPLEEKFRTFAVSVSRINGHEYRDLADAIKTESGLPQVIVLDTVKGKGVSFMENRMEWHYLPMTPAQYRQAVEEVERG